MLCITFEQPTTYPQEEPFSKSYYPFVHHKRKVYTHGYLFCKTLIGLEKNDLHTETS